jgi:hypothetical protein
LAVRQLASEHICRKDAGRVNGRGATSGANTEKEAVLKITCPKKAAAQAELDINRTAAEAEMTAAAALELGLTPKPHPPRWLSPAYLSDETRVVPSLPLQFLLEYENIAFLARRYAQKRRRSPGCEPCTERSWMPLVQHMLSTQPVLRRAK